MSASGDKSDTGRPEVQPELFAPQTNLQAETSLATNQFPGEKAAVQQLIADMRRVLGPLQGLITVSPGSTDSLDKLEDALKRLPSGGTLAEAIDAFRERAQEVIAQSRRERVGAFGRIEAEFIRGVQAAGETVREQAEGWRIGSIELQVKREQAQIRALYNGETVIGWTKVTNLQDLQRLRQKALEALKRMTISEAKLQEMFSQAYEEINARRQRSTNSTRISLRDFYPEFRLALARSDVSRKPDATLSFPEFPVWAFLYNLDRYRRLAGSILHGERLTFETGSQVETRRLGMVINGLDPSQDYTKICFITRG